MSPVARGPRGEPASVVGANLSRERIRQGKTMSDLARKSGTHVSEISRLERGLRDPRLSTLVRFARGREVPLSDLVHGVE